MQVLTAVLMATAALAVVYGTPVSKRQTRDSSYLLPTATTPTPNTYTIRLSPDLEAGTFNGSLSLSITATSTATRTITLHSASITIDSINVTDDGGNDLYDTHTFDVDRDFLVISLSNETEPYGTYIIDIEYKGILQDNMYGFYKSTYSTDEGETRIIAATQFQTTHARKAFPCFDEPKYKATFKITIDTPAGYHSLSNTLPVDNCTDDVSVRRDIVFEETPTMSTYLIAFIVSDYEYYFTTSEGLLYRSWTRYNAMDGLNYSISVSPGIMHAMEEFVNIPFTYSGITKVDQVALPDFSAGAMENWGLITYRETALLYRPGVNTATNKQRVATVIGHEIVHSWFGNLVTTEWWDSTWLNEGFARIFQYYSTSKVETDWRLMEQFVVTEHQTVMATDALTSAHALTAECYTPSQISAMFSTLSYAKGGSVLRMWWHSLGENTFRNGLRKYLRARQFNTASPSQLFSYLQAEIVTDNVLPAHVNALVMLRSWTEQPGFPVVKVERCYDDATAEITQHRFLLSPDTESGEDLMWKIPISWATAASGFDDTSPKAWLTGETDIITSGLPAADQWVIFNVQETGYYRVNYDADNWNMLISQLGTNHALIHPVNRAQLVDDSMNLARAGELAYDTALRVTDYLREELDYIPWTAAFNAFTFLNRRLTGHEDYPFFRTHVLELLGKVYEDLGFEDSDSHVEKLHRNAVLTWACNMGHEACNQNVDTKLRNFINNGVTIAPDIQSVVYCAGLRNSDYEEWEFLWNRYRTSLDFSEQAILITALGCTNNATTLDAYLLKSIDTNGDIRKQDASTVFAAVYANPAGVEVALQFLENNFDAILAYYGSMGSIGTITRGIAAMVSTEQQRTRLAAFVEANKDSLAAAGTAALQTAEENLSWTSTYQEHIFTYLKDDGTGSSTPAATTAPVEESSTSSVATSASPSSEATSVATSISSEATSVATSISSEATTTSSPVGPTNDPSTLGSAHSTPYILTVVFGVLVTLLFQSHH